MNILFDFWNFIEHCTKIMLDATNCYTKLLIHYETLQWNPIIMKYVYHKDNFKTYVLQRFPNKRCHTSPFYQSNNL